MRARPPLPLPPPPAPAYTPDDLRSAVDDMLRELEQQQQNEDEQHQEQPGYGHKRGSNSSAGGSKPKRQKRGGWFNKCQALSVLLVNGDIALATAMAQRFHCPKVVEDTT